MWEYANGIDNSEVKYIKEKPKGIGNSVTLPQDITNIEKLEEILLAITEQVTYRLRKYNMYASTVNVQLRNKEFKDFSHQKKLISPTSSTKIIYKEAKTLLGQMYIKGTPIRLVGMRVDGLKDTKQDQISLFENIQTAETQSIKKQENLDKTIDKLKEKYGYNFIKRATNLDVEDIIQFKKDT